MREETTVNDACTWIKLTQIGTKLPQDGHAVDPGADAQVFHTLKPPVRNLACNRLPGFEFPHEEAVKVDQYLLFVISFAPQGMAHLPKGMKIKCNRASKSTCRHSVTSPLARA